MPIGLQEIAALAIVSTIVVFAIYRRWRRDRKSAGACNDCASKPASDETEKPLRFHRRRK